MNAIGVNIFVPLLLAIALYVLNINSFMFGVLCTAFSKIHHVSKYFFVSEGEVTIFEMVLHCSSQIDLYEPVVTYCISDKNQKHLFRVEQFMVLSHYLCILAFVTGSH